MKIHIRRLLLVLAVSVSPLALAGSGAVHAAPPPPSVCPPDQPGGSYPPGSCRLVVEPTTVEAGGTIDASGCGFAPGSRVMLVLVPTEKGKPTPLARLTADESGCIAVDDVAVPDRTKPGTYVVTATGKDSNGRAYQLVSDPVTVTAPAAQIEASPVAHTVDDPSSPLLVLAGAAGLGLLGSALSVRVRRRRRSG